jgi:hypothetical protein
MPETAAERTAKFIFEAVDNTKRTIANIRREVRDLTAETGKGVGGYKDLGISYSDTIEKGKDMISTYGRIDRTGKRIVEGVKVSRRAHERFRFEWLGILFAGQALQRMFAGYIQKVDEMTGISELFSTAISLMVFNAVEPFLENIYGLIGGLFELPEPVKKVVGVMALLGYVVGGVMGTLGQFYLGMMSIKMLAPAVIPFLHGIAAGIGTIGSALITIAPYVAVILALAIAVKLLWDGITGLVRELEKLQNISRELGYGGLMGLPAMMMDFARGGLKGAMVTPAAVGQATTQSMVFSPTYNVSGTSLSSDFDKQRTVMDLQRINEQFAVEAFRVRK